MSRIIQKVAILFFSGLCLTAAASAQSATATLSGTVVDENGAIVTGASVIITDAARAFERQTTTNEDGFFSFASLQPTNYTLRVERSGFAATELKNVSLNVGDLRSVQIELKAGQVSGSVNVEAANSTIQESATVGTVINRQFVENLPLNGRSLQSLIQLTPGVVPTQSNTAQQGQFSVNGQRESGNYFTVDGVSANIGIAPSGANFNGAGGQFPGYSVTGGTTNLISVDALQEFKIQTSNFAPEFGRSPGGQVSLVSRTGTNEIRGTLFEYFRNDKLDTNDFFANRSGLKKPALRSNQFGGVIGGPVFLPRFGEGGETFYDGRNKTFFFFSYEGLRLRLPTVATVSVPSLAARNAAIGAARTILNAFPIPNGRDLGNNLAEFAGGYSEPSTSNATSFRIDQNIGTKLTLFGRYNYAPSETAPRGVGGGSLSVYTPTSLKTQTLTLSATYLPTSSLVNDFRFNYSRNVGSSYRVADNYGGATPPDESTLFPSFTSNHDGVVSLYINRALSTSPVLFLGGQGTNSQRQINFVDTLSYTAGTHQLKFGIDYRRFTPVFDFVSYQQTVNFNSVSAVISGNVASAIIQTFAGPFFPRFTNFSVFGQDIWRATPRLTLIYGLRYELNPPPSEKNGNDPRSVTGVESISTVALASQGAKPYRTTYNNFAPRVGASYQLVQSPGRETVIRGGIGFFYDISSTQTGAAYRAFSYPYAATRNLANVTYPFSAANAAEVSFTTAPPYSLLYGTDPNIKLPFSIQGNLAVEQSLGVNQTLSATYVMSLGRRLYRTEFYQNQIPNFTGLRLVRNLDSSAYHALQLQYNRRLTSGLQTLASYTWSHSIDTSSSENNNYLPAYISVVERDRASSDFDRRHSFNAAVTYNIPAPKTGAVGKAIFGGFSLDGIYKYLSAAPVDVFTSSGTLGVNLRPNLVSGAPLYLFDVSYPGGKRFNAAAFVAQTANNGSLGRNALRGFDLSQFDLALRRQFNFTENANLQLKVETFNLFNRANFANPSGNLGTLATFGLASQSLNRNLGGLNAQYQIGGPRSIQLVARIQF